MRAEHGDAAPLSSALTNALTLKCQIKAGGVALDAAGRGGSALTHLVLVELNKTIIWISEAEATLTELESSRSDARTQFAANELAMKQVAEPCTQHTMTERLTWMERLNEQLWTRIDEEMMALTRGMLERMEALFAAVSGFHVRCATMLQQCPV